MNKISLSAPYRNRIDYIAAATLYCWHRWISKAGTTMEIRIDHIIRQLVSVLLPKRYLYRLYRNNEEMQEASNLMLRNLECGQYISIAKNMVRHTFGGYLVFPMAVVACIISSLIGWDIVLDWKDGMIYFGMSLIGMVLVVIGLCILTKVFNDPQDYISYFKEFQKQDEEWLKRWKRYTILLFVGGIASAAMGMGTVFYSLMHT